VLGPAPRITSDPAEGVSRDERGNVGNVLLTRGDDARSPGANVAADRLGDVCGNNARLKSGEEIAGAVSGSAVSWA
jgi:hypothetical protein